jgi:hypothetical protein
VKEGGRRNALNTPTLNTTARLSSCVARSESPPEVQKIETNIITKQAIA